MAHRGIEVRTNGFGIVDGKSPLPEFHKAIHHKIPGLMLRRQQLTCKETKRPEVKPEEMIISFLLTSLKSQGIVSVLLSHVKAALLELVGVGGVDKKSARHSTYRIRGSRKPCHK